MENDEEAVRDGHVTVNVQEARVCCHAKSLEAPSTSSPPLALLCFALPTESMRPFTWITGALSLLSLGALAQSAEPKGPIITNQVFFDIVSRVPSLMSISILTLNLVCVCKQEHGGQPLGRITMGKACRTRLLLDTPDICTGQVSMARLSPRLLRTSGLSLRACHIIAATLDKHAPNDCTARC